MKEKIILVTGGASGIGLAITEKFAAAGAKVYVLDFNVENGQKVVKGFVDQGYDVHFKLVDVATRLK
jgi:2-keto-3-deoxy-L-fuconate dehydrogenase